MDFFSGIVVAGLIGKTIWDALRESPEEKSIREKKEQIAKERERKRLEATLAQWRKTQEAIQAERKRRQEAEEAERRERQRPFKTSLECFKKQYVSYTRIATYNSCPQRFKLIYMDKQPVAVGDFSERHYEGGRAFHTVLEDYFKQYVGSTINKLEYNDIIGGGRWYLSQTPWEDQRKKRMKRLRFICRTFPKDVEILAVEKELSFKVNDIPFYGIVDLALKYPDGTVEIVDYKTGIRLPIKEQLEIYAIPFTQFQDISQVDFRVISPDRQSHYKWSLSREGIVESRNHILGLVNTILNDSDFTPTISSKCSTCSVSYACEHSDIYRKTKRVSDKKNCLTKLTSAYEWKNGIKPPKKISRRSKNAKGKSKKKRDRGLSYSLSKAKGNYECFKTRKPIQVGDYYFVNHRGKRFCIDAFIELYPDRAKQLIEKRTSQVHSRHHRRYISSSYEKTFHRPDCQFAKGLTSECLIVFKSRQDALNRGYEPCTRCKP